MNQNRTHMIIAIDGPAGSGKSTTARLVAKQLGFVYVDTGAMYRAVTLSWIKQGKPEINLFLTSFPTISLSIDPESHEQHTFLNGHDVSQDIRNAEVTQHVSYISSLKEVRESMVHIQRNIGNAQSVVMDGRDIGTAVFPNAHLKVFMIADIRKRAMRRLHEMELQHMQPIPALDEVIHSMQKRDNFDSSRDIDPLIKAPDAILLDTSDLTINEQAATIIDLATNIIKQSTLN